MSRNVEVLIAVLITQAVCITVLIVFLILANFETHRVRDECARPTLLVQQEA